MEENQIAGPPLQNAGFLRKPETDPSGPGSSQITFLKKWGGIFFFPLGKGTFIGCLILYQSA